MTIKTTTTHAGPCVWAPHGWLQSRGGGYFSRTRSEAFDVPLYDQSALDAAVERANAKQNAAWRLMVEKMVVAEREQWERLVLIGLTRPQEMLTTEEALPAVAGPVQPTAMQRTPGPWVVGIGRVKQLDGEHLGVGLPQAEPGGNWTPVALLSLAEHANDADIANARLIAAAPELLEALLTAETLLYAHGKPIAPAITAALVKAGARAA